MTNKITKSDFRIAAFPAKGLLKIFLIVMGPLIDRILGFRKLKKLFDRYNLEGLEKKAFVKRGLEMLQVDYNVNKTLSSIPVSGPLIIVSNHPYGGVEGVILADFLSGIRDDVKFMANSGLSLVKEMNDFFIFTNPLVTNNYKNISSIRGCQSHLENNGLLVLFPAGKVSYFRKDKNRISDGEWNRIAAKLSVKLNIPVLPIFFAGFNSKLFQTMGKIYYRFKLLMLTREMMKMKGKTVQLYLGNLIKPEQLKGSSREITDFLRIQTYLQDPNFIFRRQIESDNKELPELIPAVPFDLIKDELEQLPEKQHLLNFKNYSVYYGYYAQLKNTVREITRLRELTFREMEEGSGADRDTDRFDKTYTQLFIINNDTEEIIGAYRMGQIDLLLKNNDIKDIYLSKMFNFKGEFYSKIKSGVEMGRSFLISSEQKSIYGFFLLWRGIGEFMVRNPKYRYLYGTVSLSNIYDPRSIALMHRVLVGEKNKVEPVTDIDIQLHPEVEEYLTKNKLNLKELDKYVKLIEPDGKGLPVLVRQYAKLGAQFVSIGSDIEFRRTPGMLLIVNTGEAPAKTIQRYFAEGTESYLNYKPVT
ncbi:MAG: lysophospholipid acyltransferase family protein [Spirochaetales bacterium]|nr:lysophospholipid acyltransferase family protein [Spirochaetales bacterium]